MNQESQAQVNFDVRAFRERIHEETNEAKLQEALVELLGAMMQFIEKDYQFYEQLYTYRQQLEVKLYDPIRIYCVSQKNHREEVMEINGIQSSNLEGFSRRCTEAYRIEEKLKKGRITGNKAESLKYHLGNLRQKVIPKVVNELSN